MESKLNQHIYEMILYEYLQMDAQVNQIMCMYFHTAYRVFEIISKKEYIIHILGVSSLS